MSAEASGREAAAGAAAAPRLVLLGAAGRPGPAWNGGFTWRDEL
jgi:hypothetical protein